MFLTYGGPFWCLFCQVQRCYYITTEAPTCKPTDRLHLGPDLREIIGVLTQSRVSIIGANGVTELINPLVLKPGAEFTFLAVLTTPLRLEN